jgi:hypothetical protein
MIPRMQSHDPCGRRPHEGFATGCGRGGVAGSLDLAVRLDLVCAMAMLAVGARRGRWELPSLATPEEKPGAR